MTSRPAPSAHRFMAALEGRLLRGVALCTTRRTRVLVLWTVMVALALPGILQVRQDNAPEVFFLQDAEELARYRQFQMDFSRDRTLRLVLSGEGLWTREALAWLGRVERQVREIHEVFGVAGLYHHHRQEGEWPPDPEGFREQVLADPLDVAAGWVSADGTHISILVGLYRLAPEKEAAVLESLERILETAPVGLDTRLGTGMAGLPVIQHTFDQEQRRFAITLFPWLILLAGGALWLLLGRLGTAVRLMAFVGAVEAVLLGVLGWSGQSFSMVTILLLPLVFVITLATAVHVLLAFRRLGWEKPEAAGEAAWRVYREKAWPVWWTGVTTAAGFGSLAVSSVPPVRDLGLWAAAGLGVLTLAAFTLLPALLTFEPAIAPGRWERWGAGWGRRGARWALARRGGVIGVFALVAVVALAGLPRLQQDSSLLSYLPADHTLRQEIEDLETVGLATVAGDLLIQPRVRGSEEGSSRAEEVTAVPFFATAEGLERLARLTTELRRLPGLLGAVGAGEVLASARQRMPATSPETLLHQLEEEADSRDVLAVLRTRDGRQARVILLLPVVGFQELEPVLQQARQRAEELFPDHRVWVTGRFPLVLAAQRSLLSTMVASLGLTLLVVAVVFLLVLPGIRLAGLAILVNLWPVAMVLGLLAWGRVPVDSSTLMIAAVVLGLAVDDTFHTLGRYRWLGKKPTRSGGEGGRTVATLQGIAPAHLLSSGILAAGFGLCGLSAFVPISRFGVLAALGILAALVADLLLVPALLGRRET